MPTPQAWSTKIVGQGDGSRVLSFMGKGKEVSTWLGLRANRNNVNSERGNCCKIIIRKAAFWILRFSGLEQFRAKHSSVLFVRLFSYSAKGKLVW